LEIFHIPHFSVIGAQVSVFCAPHAEGVEFVWVACPCLTTLPALLFRAAFPALLPLPCRSRNTMFWGTTRAQLVLSSHPGPPLLLLWLPKLRPVCFSSTCPDARQGVSHCSIPVPHRPLAPPVKPSVRAPSQPRTWSHASAGTSSPSDLPQEVRRLFPNHSLFKSQSSITNGRRPHNHRLPCVPKIPLEISYIKGQDETQLHPPPGSNQSPFEICKEF